MKSFILTMLLTASLSGCATSRDSVLMGVGIGSALGAGAGYAAGNAYEKPRTGATIGAAVGALLGGLAGWWEHNKRGNGPSQPQLHFPSSGDAPSLNMPQVRKVWVPARIEGERYESGHWVFLIDRNATWQLDDARDRDTKKDAQNGK